MVKTLVSVLLSLIVIVGAAFAENAYLRSEFTEFGEALETLYDKAEEKTANAEDGKAVRDMWYQKKKTLHILVPHTSISYVDYWLDEAIGLIRVQSYDAARAKIEVLLDICANLPGGYAISLENIF